MRGRLAMLGNHGVLERLLIGISLTGLPSLTFASGPAPDLEQRTEPASEYGDDDDDNDEFLLNEVVGAEAIYPQDMAEIQLTLEGAYQDRREDHLGSVAYLVEVGATDWWQFELAWTAPMLRGGRGIATETGVGDVELGTQFTWMHMRGSPFSGALSFEMGIPVSGQETEFSEGELEYEPFATFAVDPPGGRAQLFTNVGIGFTSEEWAPSVNAGVIGSVSIVRPYTVFSYTPGEAYLVPGVSLILPKDWEIVIGLPVGLTRTSDLIGAGLILIYEFNPLTKRRAARRKNTPDPTAAPTPALKPGSPDPSQ